MSERKETPQARYDRANTVQLKLKLNLRTDYDIIDKLDSVPNKSAYLKYLMRNDMFGSKTVD